MKKIFSLAMMLAILVTFQPFVYGETVDIGDNTQLNVVALNEHSVLMYDNEEKTSAIINVTENNDKLTVYVKESSGDEGYFTWDKNSDTIYSSYTGVTSDASELRNSEESSLMSATSSKSYRVSYRTLSNYVSDISNAYGVAAAIITIVASIAGVTIATGPAGVVTIIGGIIAVISAGLSAKNPNSGIVVTISSKVITKHQGGKKHRVTVWNISSVGTY